MAKNTGKFEAHSIASRTPEWTMSRLWSEDAPKERALDASRRLLALVREFPPSAAAVMRYVGDGSGRVEISLQVTADSGLTDGDVDWIFESLGTATRASGGMTLPEFGLAWEVSAPSFKASITPIEQGALVIPDGERVELHFPHRGRMDSLQGLLEGIAAERAPVAYVVHLGPATDLEMDFVTDDVWRSRTVASNEALRDYLGTPLRVRAFVLSAAEPGKRVLAAVRRFGDSIQIERSDEEPNRLLEVRPEILLGAARAELTAETLCRLPASGSTPRKLGIVAVAPTAPAVPITDELPEDGVIRLGTAQDASGASVEVALKPHDLLRHMQIVGSSGTGKTTLLAALVNGASRAGIGCSVISPHPDLAERLLAEIPCSIDVKVVRSGDMENPVPVNPLSSGIPTGFDLLTRILQELIDPNVSGMFGQRARRIIQQCFQASTLLVGDRANLTLVEAIMADQRLVNKIADALAYVDRKLSTELRSEIGHLSSHEFAEVAAWANSRLQSIVGAPTIRAILGSGVDAVDVQEIYDDAGVLLVDLDSTVVGVTPAQLLGEFWLVKHFDALARRKDRTRPHLLIVDECHLFSSGMLPRLLAEGRKFGLGVVIAHQHFGQLSPGLREAAQGNASTLVAFRAGPSEAPAIHARLGQWPGGSLTRLPNLQAAITCSTEKVQTSPFTLRVDHNDRASKDEMVAVGRELASHRQFVDPYRDIEHPDATTLEEATHTLRMRRALTDSGRPSEQNEKEASFFDEWLARKKRAEELRNAKARKSAVQDGRPPLVEDQTSSQDQS